MQHAFRSITDTFVKITCRGQVLPTSGALSDDIIAHVNIH